MFLQSQKQVLLKEDQFQLQNLDDTMIEEIYLSSLNILDQETESLGNATLLIWICIITSLYSLKGSEKNQILTDSWQSRVLLTSLRKELERSFL